MGEERSAGPPCNNIPQGYCFNTETPQEQRLKAEGWERRFTADLPRALEMAELYKAMGLEVRLEKIDPSPLPPECQECHVLTQGVTVYTRRR